MLLKAPRMQGYCLFQLGGAGYDGLSLWRSDQISWRFTYVIRLRGELADVPVASL